MGKLFKDGISKKVQYEAFNIMLLGGLTLAEFLILRKTNKEREKSLETVKELLNRKPSQTQGADTPPFTTINTEGKKTTSEQYLRNLNSYVEAIKWNYMSDEERIKATARKMGYDVGD